MPNALLLSHFCPVLELQTKGALDIPNPNSYAVGLINDDVNINIEGYHWSHKGLSSSQWYKYNINLIAIAQWDIDLIGPPEPTSENWYFITIRSADYSKTRPKILPEPNV